MRAAHRLAGIVIASVVVFQSGSVRAQQGLGGAGRGLPPELMQCADLTSALLTVATQDARLHDWPNLERYRQANRAVTRATAVFMGDSITDIWQQPRFGEFFPGKDYVDRGISAQTTSQMLLRMRPDVIALKPKVVVILAGTNDIAGNTGPTTLEAIEDNLASMSELARADGIRGLLSSLLPATDYHKRDGQPKLPTPRRQH